MTSNTVSPPGIEHSAVERFLRYVTYDTRADPRSDTYPSTASQLVLLRRLTRELEELGAEGVTMDEHGYVIATIPASPGVDPGEVPVIGFVAHVDTSPEMPGVGVEPILHESYDGGVIRLPDDPEAVLDPAEDDQLAAAQGHDIVTASGATLLGADDKAGVAILMAAAELWLSDPSLPRGEIRLAFTPDEEVGEGTKFFDVEAFGARYAYTLDGGGAGELEYETFSANGMRLTFHGFNTHPGYAQGKLVNALKVAGDFLARLPREGAPETTAGRDGFVHPYRLEGGVDEARVELILRDFDTARLRHHEALLRRLADEAVAAWPGSAVDVEVTEQYRNMREVLDEHPRVVEVAREAIDAAGLEVRSKAIRGGTDGSKLSFAGLPTPNLFSGQHNIHSRLEWADCWEMGKAVEVVLDVARRWAGRG